MFQYFSKSISNITVSTSVVILIFLHNGFTGNRFNDWWNGDDYLLLKRLSQSSS